MLREKLPRPFFVLAPMDDVTDTVFRQVIVDCAPSDLFITEFVNVDGLQSPGRSRLLHKLAFTGKEKPIVAQLWGKDPKNFKKTAKELVKMGFDGIDLNFGCPVKAVVKNGCCVALVNNRELAREIIQATKEGASSLPLSVKTRLGLNEVDFIWHEFLLSQKLNTLTIHGRTAKQQSGVPADWEAIAKVRQLRDQLSPATLIVGNGDVMNRKQGQQLAAKYQLDGIMIGRGIFHNPFVFSKNSPWENYTKEQRIALYRKHVELFTATYQNGERRVQVLNKYCKIYINGFDGAKELREKLMTARSTDELLRLLSL